MQNPFDVTIQNQADDEQITKIWRHHPVTLIKPGLRVLALALVPFLLFVFTGFSMFVSTILLTIFLVIGAMVLTYAAYEWVSWYGDVYVLTNYRLIDIEQRGFFHRKFSEAPLSRIQDVNFEISGVTQTFFNYGNVVAQTAGTEANLTLDSVKDPQQQNIYILKKQQELLDKKDQPLSADELIKLLAKHRQNLDELAKKEAAAGRAQRDEQVKRAAAKKSTKRRGIGRKRS